MKVMKKSKRGEGCSEYEGTGEDLEEVKQWSTWAMVNADVTDTYKDEI